MVWVVFAKLEFRFVLLLTRMKLITWVTRVVDRKNGIFGKGLMIVGEVMTTKLVTVAPDDTLSHAANLLRQYQFHHLPVVRMLGADGTHKAGYGTRNAALLLEGMLTSYDIDLVVALGKQSSSGDL